MTFAFHRLVIQQRAIIAATKAAEAVLAQTSYQTFIPKFTTARIRGPSLIVCTLWMLTAALVAFLFIKFYGHARPVLSSDPSIDIQSVAEQSWGSMDDFFKLLSGGFLGGLVGSLMAHFFACLRDRENRKRTFRGFLEEWRAVVEKTSTDDIPKQYFEHVSAFRREAEKVRGDFKGKYRQRFSDLVVALGHMTPQAIRGDGKKESRNILADAIQNFINFVRNERAGEPLTRSSSCR